VTTPLTVLFSFPSPRPTSVNPYTILLAEHIRREGLRVLYFEWTAALFGRYDVFHVHWPEILVGGRTPLRRLVRQMLTVLILLRLTVTRRGLVRTLHNLELPEGLSRSQLLVLRLVDRRTDAFIRLNEFTPVAKEAPFWTIPHPDYRDWFTGFERSEPVEGQVGFVGRIRRYKGVESLIGAVSMIPRELALTARIAGYPSTSALAKSIAELAFDDERISLEFGFVSDATLVDLITSSELVVLPYRLMHNSGAALVALSLDRPVLVPRNPVTIALALEVGEGWVHTYDGQLEAEDIMTAIAALRNTHRDLHPALGRRSWTRATRSHVEVYARALRLARRRGDGR
jgi:glycosyltransferase involved in cell wall biosynthesis